MEMCNFFLLRIIFVLIPLTLVTPSFDFPKTSKKWVLYLSPSGEHNSVMHDDGDANMVSIES